LVRRFMGTGEEFQEIGNDELWKSALQTYAEADYFEVHEILEELWRRTAGDEARFYQGMLQAAVALHHYCNGNFHGAKLLAERAPGKLEGLPDDYFGIDLGRFKKEFEVTMAPVFERKDGLEPLDPADAPEIVPV